MKYNERMRKIRIEQGYTQKEIAKLLNISQSTYSKYERGKSIIPTKKFVDFCKITKVSADYYLGLSKNTAYPKL